MQVVLGADARVHVEPSPDVAPEAPGDVLLAPAHMGICGSDVHVLHSRHPFARPPVVTGHEIVARVLDTGSEVRRVAPGDTVVVNPLLWCGACPRCLAGAVNQCADAKVRGFKVPGSPARGWSSTSGTATPSPTGYPRGRRCSPSRSPSAGTPPDAAATSAGCS